MNKALPWNVNGVGFDAREAAREAARRQGKSLGEWLHGVIADHAADLGIPQTEMGGRQRVEAVTSKLERLSARSAEHERRRSADRHEEPSRARPRDYDDERTDPLPRARSREREEERRAWERPIRSERRSEDHALRRRRHSTAIHAAEQLLEEAVDAMERRATRVERQTETALQSVADLIERNEASRERERDSVRALSDKLTSIESRLSERLGAPEANPLRGTLARLEARLDAIGRRSAAETSAAAPLKPEPSEAIPPTSSSEPFERLEAKLNSILAVVGARPASPAASAPVATDPPRLSTVDARPERRLGDAIASINQRQRDLDRPQTAVSPAVLLAATPRHDIAPVSPLADVQKDIAALSAMVGELRRDIAGQRANVNVDALTNEIATMSDTLRQMASAPAPGAKARLRMPWMADDASAQSLAEISSQDTGVAGLERIEDQMQEIRNLLAASLAAPKESQAPRDAEPNGAELGRLETMIRDLTRKIEAVKAPGSDQMALNALQQQVAKLATRFEQTGHGLETLASLERSIRDIFAHLDETRASVETSAARVAREVIGLAADEGRLPSDREATARLAALQALHEDAETRTNSALTAVQATLGKVVDRLAVMESDIAHANQRGRAADPSPEAPIERRKPAKEVNSAPTLDRPDPILSHRPGDSAPPASPAPKRLELDEDGGRADFIAAARRAAKVAQADAAAAELKRAGPKSGNDSRAGLVAQSRDYVSQHKRPVLLGLAALFVVLGTMAIVQKLGFEDGSSLMADASRPAQAVASAPSTPVTTPAAARPTGADDALSPNALPARPPTPLASRIPGSDPVQTGSITSLPSFAAGAAPARPGVPTHLRALAESGDAAAAYVLGAQYAEGRVVARDFAEAAKWYQKAAAQNLAPAQYRLASLFEKGLGVAQNKARAQVLYRQAAEAGNPRAMHNLAVLLAEGDGKPDYEGAATWFRKAAQYGIRDSQYNLAILLARGIGVQQSLVQSYQWFAIAAAQGDTDAGKKRDEVATKLSATDLAVAKALASAFHPRTADIAATDVQLQTGV